MLLLQARLWAGKVQRHCLKRGMMMLMNNKILSFGSWPKVLSTMLSSTHISTINENRHIVCESSSTSSTRPMVVKAWCISQITAAIFREATLRSPEIYYSLPGAVDPVWRLPQESTIQGWHEAEFCRLCHANLIGLLRFPKTLWQYRWKQQAVDSQVHRFWRMAEATLAAPVNTSPSSVNPCAHHYYNINMHLYSFVPYR